MATELLYLVRTGNLFLQLDVVIIIHKRYDGTATSPLATICKNADVFRNEDDEGDDRKEGFPTRYSKERKKQSDPKNKGYARVREGNARE